ncbi:UNVERIFIED_CONTAM: short-chain dehydrogenase, partial [Salmonella enterica subsp. enterica serovar Weltevreden]
AIRSQFGATASAGVSKRGGQASFYAKIADAIAARANASQQHSTPAEDFARKLADAALSKQPPPTIRLGNGSLAMPLAQ